MMKMLNSKSIKYKNIFAKGYTTNWSENIFVIKKVKNTAPQTYVTDHLNGEEITGKFYEKELREFWIEKVIKIKGDKLFGKVMPVHLIVGLIKKINPTIT